MKKMIRSFIKNFNRKFTKIKTFNSSKYWEERYASGGNSGLGSYGKLAEFKAEIINNFIKKYKIISVIEFGFGDGNQLELMDYKKYLGLDVSETAVTLCKEKFRSDSKKKFRLMNAYKGEMADLSLSLDVIYHLIEDEVFEDYIKALFKASNRYVVIYSSNTNANNNAIHVKHRKFTKWIEENIRNWELDKEVLNKYPYKNEQEGSLANFYMYKKI